MIVTLHFNNLLSLILVFSKNHFLMYFPSYLEKEMATHSSVLAWRIPGTGEPAGLMSTESDMTEAT